MSLRNPKLAFAVALAFVASIPSPSSAQRPPDIALSAAMNREVIENTLKAINKYYLSAEGAKRIDDEIRPRLSRGEYDRITSAYALMDVLDKQLLAASKDPHLSLRYSHEGSPLIEGKEHQPESAQDREEGRKIARSRNFGFEKVARLSGNIGHLDIRSFERPEYAGETLAAVMTFLANTDALIIDLRQSRGGSLDMVPYLASYFFGGEPVLLGEMDWRIEKRSQQFWTVPHLPGPKYADKDLYILLSANSFSAPEGFASFLQNIKRATIVGEATRGGTHPGMIIKTHQHFAVFVPMGKPVYPDGKPEYLLGRLVYPNSKADDEGRGVKPDIAVPAAKALAAGHLNALEKKLARHPEQKSQLESLIERSRGELAR